jgi:hypothetical protein
LGFRRLIAATAEVGNADVSTAFGFCMIIIQQRFKEGDRRLASWAWLGKTLFRQVTEDTDLQRTLDEFYNEVPF